MTNEQILEQAIQKAIDGGWSNPSKYYITKSGGLAVPGSENVMGSDYSVDLSPRELIFNRDFARALWGGQRRMVCKECGSQDRTADGRECAECCWAAPLNQYGAIEWQYHLQQMVIAPNPIKYLGDNI